MMAAAHAVVGHLLRSTPQTRPVTRENTPRYVDNETSVRSVVLVHSVV